MMDVITARYRDVKATSKQGFQYRLITVDKSSRAKNERLSFVYIPLTSAQLTQQRQYFFSAVTQTFHYGVSSIE